LKKYILLITFCFTLILSAFSQSEKDTKEYSGIIGDGKSLGYEYAITKEQNIFLWKVGYKEDRTIIEENAANEVNLVNYMNAVNDSKLVLVKLILSVSYFLIVLITSLILYKKKRKILKESGVILSLFAGIAIYIAFKASIDLSRTFQDAKYYYLILTS
jgi:hypothetical protein